MSGDFPVKGNEFTGVNFDGGYQYSGSSSQVTPNSSNLGGVAAESREVLPPTEPYPFEEGQRVYPDVANMKPWQPDEQQRAQLLKLEGVVDAIRSEYPVKRSNLQPQVSPKMRAYPQPTPFIYVVPSYSRGFRLFERRDVHVHVNNPPPARRNEDRSRAGERGEKNNTGLIVAGIAAVCLMVSSAVKLGKSYSQLSQMRDLTNDVGRIVKNNGEYDQESTSKVDEVVERTQALIGRAKKEESKKVPPGVLLLAASVSMLVGAIIGSMLVIKVAAVIAAVAITWGVFAHFAQNKKGIAREADAIKELCNENFPNWFPEPTAPLEE